MAADLLPEYSFLTANSSTNLQFKLTIKHAIVHNRGSEGGRSKVLKY